MPKQEVPARVPHLALTQVAVDACAEIELHVEDLALDFRATRPSHTEFLLTSLLDAGENLRMLLCQEAFLRVIV